VNQIKAILIPGNGDSSPQDNWLPYVKTELEKIGVTVLAPQFPDTPICREKYWIPFLKKLGADESTILIGHSTGAIAAMRLAENTKILGSVLVGAYVSDLGMETEKASGYFDRPWNWDAIKQNQTFIIQFASIDDPWIPIKEARAVHKNLNTEYYEFTDKGHFIDRCYNPTFPELVEAVSSRIKALE
jgi:hypothetical protein